MSITDRDRILFEDAIWQHYIRIKAHGWKAPEEGDGSRQSLFWLQPNGQYGVASIEHAWWGWKLCRRAGWQINPEKAS